MEQQEKFVCEGCHEREAVHHDIMCYGGDVTEERHLCLECFKALVSPEQFAAHRRASEIVASGGCKYCGAPAVGGSMSFGLPGVMEEKTELWCEPCRLDLVEFDSRPENAMPDFDVEDEARLNEVSQQLAERSRRQEEFIRERVRVRMSR